MEQSIATILANGSVYQLSCMLGLALFFTISGIREMQDERPESYLFLALALFFALTHALYLGNLPANEFTWNMLPEMSFWVWLVMLLAPALITLFLIRGLFSFAIEKGRIGMVKVFFGLTLLCYLYMLGCDWPIDVKGILTIIWLTLFFKIELGVVRE